MKDVNFMEIIRQTWTFNLSVFLIYFVTLGVFPAIPVLTVTTSENETWQKYFIPIGCFLLYNVCDLLGRVVAGFIKWPRPTWAGSLFTLALTVARTAFIPLFLFCNVR